MKDKYLLFGWAALTIVLTIVMVLLSLWYMEIGKVNPKYYGGRSCFWPDRPENIDGVRIAWTCVGLVTLGNLIGLTIYVLHRGGGVLLGMVILLWCVHLYVGMELIYVYLGAEKYLPGQPCREKW
ncbi:hypothetical protein SAMN05421595_0030 [Austwickia chelonae]|uniref:Uncharacterized protein n=1 Tax=Austwickia chelonae NBRC 105200 TaxID=1184607 RepID=K6VPZ3_9MICO|nr:hypothetical protein [Austwickia chelonae]GAB78819.1 hypothetical protein AUCHE_17_00300 [Austwickia chelonae NBRC 105200]SEV84790.1 hypothetical protein SAMN05421595_0030 [Austwickia chelonae]